MILVNLLSGSNGIGTLRWELIATGSDAKAIAGAGKTANLIETAVADGRFKTLKAALDAEGVPLVLINTPPGDFEAGERGLAALPGREADFRDAMDQALDYADRLRALSPNDPQIAQLIAQLEAMR